MPDLRELLRDAAPIASSEVDLGAVRTRVRQRARRRRALVGGAVAVVVLLVAVAAAAVVSDDDKGRRIDVIDDSTTIPQPATTVGVPDATSPSSTVASASYQVRYRLPNGYIASAVVSDGSSVWAAAFVGGTLPQGRPNDDPLVGSWVVARLDRATGELTATVQMPGAVRGLSVGENVVWAWGGGDGGEPVGGVGAIDRREARLIGTLGWDPDVPQDEWLSAYGLDANGDEAWLSDATHDRVYRVHVGEGWLAGDPVEVGRQPTDVVVLTDGSVWVRESRDGTIARIDARTLDVTDREVWAGSLLADSGRLVWADNGTQLVELDPQTLADGVSVSLGRRIAHGSGWVGRVVRDADGIWVWHPNTLTVHRYLLRGPDEDPILVSTLGIARVSDIAPDGDCLLVVDNGSNAIGVWTPTA
jgi:hypothetical protein